MKIFKRLMLGLLLLILIVGGYLFFSSKMSNPHNYDTVGDIPTPMGYERIKANEPGFAEYLRSLPLKGRGTKVQLYTGGDSRFQILNYAVVNLPLLSNAEQCADVCMRLRAEYLYHQGRYGDIRFKNVNGKTMRYDGGSSRKSFERFMRRVYGEASTFSLSRSLEQRRLKDMQPGDVFVYPARKGHKYGHAVMVVDVAVNKDGKKHSFWLKETPLRAISTSCAI